MTERISSSRAARLAGVTRSEIQKKVRQGELATFEGEVLLTDLLRVFPNIELNASTMLERVELIKTAAISKALPEPRGLPSSDVLMSRINSLLHVLTELKSNLNRYEGLVNSVAKQLEVIQNKNDVDSRNEARKLYNWLRHHMEAPLEKPDSSTQLFVKDTILRIMAANVKIIPSGHEFFVEGAASILEASLAAGLNLNYGCTSGSCGLCKARVVSGDIWKIRAHDYVLSEREKYMGYILMCANTAITDLVLEAAEASTTADLPPQEIRTTVRKLEKLSTERILLHLQTPRSHTLRFMAGQRATISIHGELSATYPIASCPCDGRNLQFIIRKLSDNRFTTAVFTTLKPSQAVTLNGPEGDFVLEDDSTKPILFFALNDGFAPMRSLIEHAISIDSAESLHLYWVVDNNNEHYLDSLCRSWRDALDGFFYTPLRLKNIEKSGLNAELEQQLIEALALITTDPIGLTGYSAYVAGSQAFVETVSKLLHDNQLPLAQLRVEVMD
jgi:CDP-4-dehydro-6-deoxyglucose reductase